MKHQEPKLEALKQKREFVLSRLNARIAEEERKEANRQRKQDIREKIIVGACVLTDMEKHPELQEAVLQSLRRMATQKEIAFLKERGWKL